MTKRNLLLSGLALVSVVGSVMAVPTPYGNPGTVNPITYTFTATGTGDITAYFVGESAGFGSDVGLSINGAAPSSFGLQNHTGAGGTTSTPYGTSFIMGSANAGDTLRFVLRVSTTNYNGPPPLDYLLNSDPALNTPLGANHIYSAPYAGDALIPAGTYVGFEDILLTEAGNDLDYNDHQFVFVGVKATTPEGGLTFTLLGMAMAGIGFLRRKLG
jgi:hypothetical protein